MNANKFKPLQNLYILEARLKRKRGSKIANQQIVNYIRQNSSNYPIDELKNFLIQKGYSKKDVEEAAAAAMNIPPPDMPPKSQRANLSSPYIPASSDTSKAAIAYILTWLTGLIIYFTADKNDRFTRFHAMQAIFLGIAFTVIYIALGVILIPLSFFTLGLSFFIMPLIWIAVIIIIIMMAVSAYKGNKTKLPIIGNLAENIVEKN